MASEQLIGSELLEVVQNVLVKYGELATDDLRRRIVAARKVASGRLYKSVKYNINLGSSNVLLEISTDDYLKFIESGRSPGDTPPPIGDILKWVKIRKLSPNSLSKYAKKARLLGNRSTLQDQLRIAYAVATSISQSGIRKVKIVDDQALSPVVPEIEQQLADEMADILANELYESVYMSGNENISITTTIG